MTLPANGYVQQVEVVVGGNLPRAGFVQPIENAGGGGGLVTGSGAAGQVTFWTGAQTVSGSNSLFWDNAALTFELTGAAAGNVSQWFRVSGDTQNRLQVTADGVMSWGSGGGAVDITLKRGAAGRLDLTGSNLRLDGPPVIKSVQFGTNIDLQSNVAGTGPTFGVNSGQGTLSLLRRDNVAGLAVTFRIQGEGINNLSVSFVPSYVDFIQTNSTSGSESGEIRFGTQKTGLGAYRWSITEDGHFLPLANNSYDIGNTSFAPRSGWFKTALYVGTVTDPATAGDFAAGLVGAARIFFDQSAETFFQYDSSGNADVTINTAGNSWYNGTGNFGFGTTGPDRRVDILDATNPQLRLTYTDGAVWSDLQTNSAGQTILTNSGVSFLYNISFPGSTVEIGVRNNSNTASSGALLYARVGGTSSFDAYAQFVIGSTTTWSLGADNSDSDSFKISGSSALGTSDFLIITTTGALTFGAAAFTIDANKILFPAVTLGTTMTTGFVNIPGAAGAPTGVPATTTGYPLYYDQTNKKLYIYDGGWKKGQVAGVDVIYA